MWRFLVLFAPVAAAQHVLMDHAMDIPQGWSLGEPTPSTRKIELLFAVKQQNVQQLHDKLMEVSVPSSPKYGMHLSLEEVNELTAPTAEHVEAVLDFLNQHGIEGKRATPNADFITATVSVQIAERMLATKYHTLMHSTGATIERAVGGYSLHSGVARAIDMVSPTTHIPYVKMPVLLGSDNSSFGSLNQPKTLRQLYNIGSATGKAATNKQAVTAFLGQEYSESALKSFYKQYCSGISCGKGLPKLVGDATTGSAGEESMLDIEYITGVGGNIETEFWGFSGNSPDSPQNEPFMKWLTKMSSTSDADVPKLFSTSYGEGESTWPIAAAERLNTEFMKAGVRGISLLFASGDSGANCKGGKFTPNMPASSPYVTAVGGTQPTSHFPAPGSESAISLSSGGFSNYWGTPHWQTDAVATYFKDPSIPPSSKGYNVSGRGFPDIAAQATNFCVTPFGCGVAGTSCASPTAAGVFGLLNDLRLESGKSSLGFLNPFIYANAGAFNDITTGSGSGCGFFSSGWPAIKGWDAVTGLGTPDYEKLSAAVAKLPAGTSGMNIVV